MTLDFQRSLGPQTESTKEKIYRQKIIIESLYCIIYSIDNLIDENGLTSAFKKKCRIVIGLSRYHVRVIRFGPNKVNVASNIFFLLALYSVIVEDSNIL